MSWNFWLHIPLLCFCAKLGRLCLPVLTPATPRSHPFGQIMEPLQTASQPVKGINGHSNVVCHSRVMEPPSETARQMMSLVSHHKWEREKERKFYSLASFGIDGQWPNGQWKHVGRRRRCCASRRRDYPATMNCVLQSLQVDNIFVCDLIWIYCPLLRTNPIFGSSIFVPWTICTTWNYIHRQLLTVPFAAEQNQDKPHRTQMTRKNWIEQMKSTVYAPGYLFHSAE